MEVQKLGQFSFRATYEGDQNDYSYFQAADGQNYSLVTYSHGDKSEMALEDATEFEVPLHVLDDASYATLCVPFGITLESGVKAYAVTVSGDYANVSEIGYDVPANTPVLLVCENGYTEALVTIDESVDATVSTDLHGSFIQKTVADNELVLGQKDDVLGFYIASDVLGANKAYLPVDDAVAVKGLGLNFIETAVRTILDNEGAKSVVFNVAGQRVAQPTRGLVIKDGKKVIVK